jgi:hypothetical protein
MTLSACGGLDMALLIVLGFGLGVLCVALVWVAEHLNGRH